MPKCRMPKTKPCGAAAPWERGYDAQLVARMKSGLGRPDFIRLLYADINSAASRASAVMRAKSPAAIASLGATQEPPTAITLGSAR